MRARIEAFYAPARTAQIGSSEAERLDQACRSAAKVRARWDALFPSSRTDMVRRGGSAMQAFREEMCASRRSKIDWDSAQSTLIEFAFDAHLSAADQWPNANGIRLVRFLEEAGFPSGVLGAVIAAGRDLGETSAQRAAGWVVPLRQNTLLPQFGAGARGSIEITIEFALIQQLELEFGGPGRSSFPIRPDWDRLSTR